MSQAQPFDFRPAIEKVVSEFERAAKAKDAGVMASFYSPDAVLLPPGSPIIKGAQNIRAFWQSFLDAGAADPKLTTISVESAGELAYEVGSYEAIIPTPTGAERGSGKYLVVWKRQRDGGIKMVADMFSANS